MRWDPVHKLYWAAAPTKRTLPFSLPDFMSDKPWLRTLLLKLVPIKWVYSVLPRYGLVLGFDLKGNLERILIEPTGTVAFITEALHYKERLYFGSFREHCVVQYQLP
jgi:hypothetical protein